VDEAVIRREMVEQFQAYLRGEIALEDLIVWELEYEPERAEQDVSPALRAELDGIGLVVEEIVMGIRPTEDLRQLALEMTGAASESR
jgi:hypothetical protein